MTTADNNFNTLFPYPFLALLLLFAMGCGSQQETAFHSATQRQPYVLHVQPPPGTVLQERQEWQITFSERIDFAKVSTDSVSLIPGDLDPQLEQNPKELLKAIQEKQLALQEMHYFLSGDEKTLSLSPLGPLEEDIYHLAVTPLLQSVQGIPFNQSPGEDPSAFLARYTLGVAAGPAQPIPQPDFLLINEILYDGLESETDGEAFIELYGTPNTHVGDYTLSLINGADGRPTDAIRLPSETIIPEDGILVVADLKTGSAMESRVDHYDYLDHFDPQNGPDAVHLLNREGIILDRLYYGEGGVARTQEGLEMGEGEAALDVAPGQSLSRVGGVDTEDNNSDFMVKDFPTPGWL